MHLRVSMLWDVGERYAPKMDTHLSSNPAAIQQAGEVAGAFESRMGTKHEVAPRVVLEKRERSSESGWHEQTPPRELLEQGVIVALADAQGVTLRL